MILHPKQTSQVKLSERGIETIRQAIRRYTSGEIGRNEMFVFDTTKHSHAVLAWDFSSGEVLQAYPGVLEGVFRYLANQIPTIPQGCAVISFDKNGNPKTPKIFQIEGLPGLFQARIVTEGHPCFLEFVRQQTTEPDWNIHPIAGGQRLLFSSDGSVAYATIQSLISTRTLHKDLQKFVNNPVRYLTARLHILTQSAYPNDGIFGNLASDCSYLPMAAGYLIAKPIEGGAELSLLQFCEEINPETIDAVRKGAMDKFLSRLPRSLRGLNPDHSHGHLDIIHQIWNELYPQEVLGKILRSVPIVDMDGTPLTRISLSSQSDC